MGTIKKIFAGALMTFVLASVTWAVVQAVSTAEVSDEPAGRPDRTDVLFFHPTARCATCTTMQAMADELVRGDFADELTDGRLTWRVVNFEHHDGLAGRYNVVSSTIVVVTVRDGVQTAFARLDDAFQHADNRDAFVAYVRAAIETSLDAPHSKSDIRIFARRAP